MARIIDVGVDDRLRYPVDTTEALSPTLFGCLLAAYLCGICTLELGKFIQSARAGEESRLDCWLIYTLSLFLGVAFISELRLMQWMFAEQFGQTVALSFGPKSPAYGLYIVFGVVVNQTSQAYFAVRAARLNSSRMFGALLAVLIAVDLVIGLYAGFIFTIDSAKGQAILDIVREINWARTSYCYLAACIDIIICVAICWRLLRDKDGLGSAADSIVVRVIRLSIASMLITAIWAIVTAILFIVNTEKSSNWANLTVQSISEVYATSALVAVNQKRHLRALWSDARGSKRTLTWPQISLQLGSKSASPNEIAIPQIEISADDVELARADAAKPAHEYYVHDAERVRARRDPRLTSAEVATLRAARPRLIPFRAIAIIPMYSALSSVHVPSSSIDATALERTSAALLVFAHSCVWTLYGMSMPRAVWGRRLRQDYFSSNAPVRGTRSASKTTRQPPHFILTTDKSLKPTNAVRTAAPARPPTQPVASTSKAPLTLAAPALDISSKTLRVDRFFAMHRPLLEVQAPIDHRGQRRSATFESTLGINIPLPLPYSSDPNHPRSIDRDANAALEWQDDVTDPYRDPHDTFLVGEPSGADPDWVPGTSRHLAGLSAHVPPTSSAAQRSSSGMQFDQQTLDNIAFLAPFGLSGQDGRPSQLTRDLPPNPPPLPSISQDPDHLHNIAAQFLGREQMKRTWYDKLATLRILDELDGMAGRQRAEERTMAIKQETQRLRRQRARLAVMRWRRSAKKTARGTRAAQIEPIQVVNNPIARALAEIKPSTPVVFIVKQASGEPAPDRKQLFDVISTHMTKLLESHAQKTGSTIPGLANDETLSFEVPIVMATEGTTVSLDSTRRKRLKMMKKKKRKKALRALKKKIGNQNK